MVGDQDKTAPSWNVLISLDFEAGDKEKYDSNQEAKYFLTHAPNFTTKTKYKTDRLAAVSFKTMKYGLI